LGIGHRPTGCTEKVNVLDFHLEPVDFVIVTSSGTLQHTFNNDGPCLLRKRLRIWVVSVTARRRKYGMDRKAAIPLRRPSSLASVNVERSFGAIDGGKVRPIADTHVGKLTRICIRSKEKELTPGSVSSIGLAEYSYDSHGVND
jgi:hypothetical protein